ncbi:MAG: HlyU family transcriptional regulator [Paracoccaceae bacterium]
MSLLSKLFGGGGSKPEAKPEEYEGFHITAQPVAEGPRYRIGALIEKEVEGEMKTHTLIRADTLDDLQSAKDASVGKAKQLIDQMGERLFNG